MLYKLDELTKQILCALSTRFAVCSHLNAIGRCQSPNPTPAAVTTLGQARVSKTRFIWGLLADFIEITREYHHTASIL